ncbi:nucleotide exchange factor GrpE [Bifidobacterium aquikefiri]|mgnify:CR=1 FL=1|uniref:Protein GrpE n=1 Tax=Bifidobacterium aquikefiri TaxID=1653207 RepID=A0A261G0K3_9BIFI|nr:nucleotide exchange factor GrpE [Bifidobacterium aquikefiri]OZG64951.1 nucleotide exchange factor GrpE [Bifidobacterium aquikefiri]
MSDFDKDDYLQNMEDVESLKNDPASAGKLGHVTDESDQTPASSDAPSAAADEAAEGPSPEAGTNIDPNAPSTGSDNAKSSDDMGSEDEKSESTRSGKDEDSEQGEQSAEADTDDGELTPLGKAKKEAAEYLEALQRERAEFVNYRNRALKEQTLFRQHGITDVLTALLPALDDIDRIKEHGEIDNSFKAVSTKIDATFKKFGVEKFGEKGEDFDPTKHEAILHKPDAEAEKETVDTVVEAGYRIGDRVIRAARVVVSSPKEK